MTDTQVYLDDAKTTDSAAIVLRWYHTTKVHKTDGTTVGRSVAKFSNVSEASDYLKTLKDQYINDPFFRAAHYPFERQLQGAK